LDAVTIASFVNGGILLTTVIVFVRQARAMTNQSRATEKALLSGIYQAVTDNMLDIDHLFIDRPHLRKYFYDNEPVPEDETARDQVLAVAELFTDFVDNHNTQSMHLPNTLIEPWTTYFQSMMCTSPALQNYWRRYGSWYSQNLACLFADFPVDPLPEPVVRRTSPPRSPGSLG